MAVRSQLPVQGVDVILDNDLAGSRIWKDGPPLVHVGSVLQMLKKSDGCAKEHPKVCSSVTRAGSKALSEQSEICEQGQLSQAEELSEGQLSNFFFPFLCLLCLERGALKNRLQILH